MNWIGLPVRFLIYFSDRFVLEYDSEIPSCWEEGCYVRGWRIMMAKSPCKDYASQGTPAVGVVVDFTGGRLPMPPTGSLPSHQAGGKSGFPRLGFSQTLTPSLSLDSISKIGMVCHWPPASPCRK